MPADDSVTASRVLFAIGLVAYVVSFFVTAVYDKDPEPGFICAYLALWAPMLPVTSPQAVPPLSPTTLLVFTLMFISGLTNIVLPIAMVLRAGDRHIAFAKLRVILLGMIPCSWLVFIFLHIEPREGHVLWVLGIFLMLYSEEIGRRVRPTREGWC